MEERAAVFRSVTGRMEGRREIYCLLGADQSRGGERGSGGGGWDTFTHRRSIMNEVSDLSLSVFRCCAGERLIFKKQFPWGRRRRGIEEGVSAQVSGKAVV